MTTKTMMKAAGLLAACGAAVLVTAGPLNPPAGGVAGTYKTLTEVEPRIAISAVNTPGDANSVFRITQPGSYYLTGNVSVPAGRSGIVIAAPDVTIDLSGYQISGQAGSVSGVTNANIPYSNTMLRNGTIAAVGGDGVDLFEVSGGAIEGVHVRTTGGRGIYSGISMVVRGCTATSCDTDGIVVGPGGVVEECTSTYNGGFGFVSEFGATLTRCSARDNSGSGFKVNRSSLADCQAASNNTDGFEAGFHSRLTACASHYNSQIGIRAFDGVVIERCVITNNTRQGIRVSNQGLISRNQVISNGETAYAGIWLEGSGNRCEDNQSIGNAYGLYVSGSDNFVVRNSCRSSAVANFTVSSPATNEVAPVIQSPGVNGFATATPWSNFAY